MNRLSWDRRLPNPYYRPYNHPYNFTRHFNPYWQIPGPPSVAFGYPSAGPQFPLRPVLKPRNNLRHPSTPDPTRNLGTTAPPATPTPASPATPTPASPATPTPESPATPTPASPATPTPASPATPTPASPAIPTPPASPATHVGQVSPAELLNLNLLLTSSPIPVSSTEAATVMGLAPPPPLPPLDDSSREPVAAAVAAGRSRQQSNLILVPPTTEEIIYEEITIRDSPSPPPSPEQSPAMASPTSTVATPVTTPRLPATSTPTAAPTPSGRTGRRRRAKAQRRLIARDAPRTQSVAGLVLNMARGAVMNQDTSPAAAGDMAAPPQRPAFLRAAAPPQRPASHSRPDGVFVFTATEASNVAVATRTLTSGLAQVDNRKKRKASTEDLNNNARAEEEAGLEVKQVSKRPRQTVQDLSLDRAVQVMVKAGAILLYRTRKAVQSDVNYTWTVKPNTPKEAANNPVRFVPLNPCFFEYDSIRGDFEKTCQGQGFRVTGICRVENDKLLWQFQQQLQQLERSCGEVAVFRVYHGTRRDSVESICEGNLDPLMAGRASNHFWWGKGVNFSPISYYSSHYCDQASHRSMMVVDVLVGRACSVRNPEYAPVLPEDVGRQYDSNIKLPVAQVLCKFADSANHQYYPAYIVDFIAPEAGHRDQGWAQPDFYRQPVPRRHWQWMRNMENDDEAKSGGQGRKRNGRHGRGHRGQGYSYDQYSYSNDGYGYSGWDWYDPQGYGSGYGGGYGTDYYSYY